MTTTLQQVGLGKYLVGRSAFCRDADHLPVVGDLQRAHAEQLVRLAPTHVFVQRSQDSVDPDLRRLAELHGWSIVAQPLADLQDVQALLRRLPGIFPEAGIITRSQMLAATIDDSLRPVEVATRPNILIVSPGPSLLAWGRRTYLGQLVEAGGGQNLLASDAWTTVSLEDIARMAPDILLIPSERDPGDLTALQAAAGADRLRLLSCTAIDLPGPHLTVLADEIRTILSGSSAYHGSP